MKYIALSITLFLLGCTNLTDLNTPTSGGTKNLAVAILSPSFGSTNELPFTLGGIKGSDIMSLIVFGGSTPKIAALDGNSWSVEFIESEVVPGQNVFSVYGKDITGKTVTTVYVTLTIGDYADTLAPIVTVTSPSEGQTISSSNLTITGTASDPQPNSTGVQAVYIALNCLACFKQASGTTNWSLAVRLSNEGSPQGLYYYAVDNYGNVSHTNSYTFQFDTGGTSDNPPTVSISAPSGGQSFTALPVAMTGTASDDNSVVSVEVSINGGAYKKVSGTLSWSTNLYLATGNYTAIVRAKDSIGQYSPQKSVTFSVYTNTGTGHPYYNGINPGSPTLKQDLNDLIDGHSSQSYDSLWTHFQSTDKKVNGKVWDMYSDIPGGTPPYEYTFVSGQCGSYSGEGSCYNREHSWPKSWFNDLTPMYSDLFHLYPTDGYVNGQRGNYAFGEVNSASWTSQNGSKKGVCTWPGYPGINPVFEPIDEYKGDFARTYFYMCIRYYGEDSGWSSSDGTYHATLLSWMEAMLRAWHTQDPVSQKEIDRNEAVYLIQGNRNPFIDHPEWVNLIADF
ncbi:MAG: hypothetical protein A2Y33_15915 [Spirochaetes bacterium GWF1_51_8]|nr:MAG: hypothetical protein A2Y33_15915 [Spirochaetes bacterium GWF1_51_8]